LDYFLDPKAVKIFKVNKKIMSSLESTLPNTDESHAFSVKTPKMLPFKKKF